MAKFQPTFEFKFKPSYYTTHGAETLARKDMKAFRNEYTRMRDVAQKRIQRLQKDYDWTTSGKQSYQLETKEGTVTKMGFPKLSEIRPEDLPKAFRELASFVKYSGSTRTGQQSMQEKTTATLNKAIGTDEEKKKMEDIPEDERPVNKANYMRIIQVMNETRRLKINSIYGSDTIADFVNKTLSLSKDDFDKVLDNLDKFLSHTDTIDADIEFYRNEHDGEIDMDDFLEKVGW